MKSIPLLASLALVFMAPTAVTALEVEDASKPKKPKDVRPFYSVNPGAPERPGLEHRIFFSELNQLDLGYYIYLPPGYEEPANAQKQYPVVYFLHGGRPGNERKCVGLVSKIAPAMEAGRIPPMIYVFINGGEISHYDYPARKCYGESGLIKELIPHIDAAFRTIAKREGRAIEGFSMGARGAARIALKYPHLFSSCATMSGAFQHEKYAAEHDGFETDPSDEKNFVDGAPLRFAAGDNTYDLARNYVEKRMNEYPVSFFVAVSEADFNLKANVAWMDYLHTLKIPFENKSAGKAGYVVGSYYDVLGDSVMRFHADNFRRAGAAFASN